MLREMTVLWHIYDLPSCFFLLFSEDVEKTVASNARCVRFFYSLFFFVRVCVRVCFAAQACKCAQNTEKLNRCSQNAKHPFEWHEINKRTRTCLSVWPQHWREVDVYVCVSHMTTPRHTQRALLFFFPFSFSVLQVYWTSPQLRVSLWNRPSFLPTGACA